MYEIKSEQIRKTFPHFPLYPSLFVSLPFLSFLFLFHLLILETLCILIFSIKPSLCHLLIYCIEIWIWKSGQRLKTVLFSNQFLSPVWCHMKRTKANQNFLVFLRDKYNFCDTYLIIPSQIEGIGLGPLGPFLIYCPSIELDPFILSLSPHLLGQIQLIWWAYW